MRRYAEGVSAETTRRTKIVATVGPASSSPETLLAIAKAGMDAARLNFSHGTHEEHAERIRLVREVSKEIDRPIAIVADLQGPKVRIGELAAPVTLDTGDEVTASCRLLRRRSARFCNRATTFSSTTGSYACASRPSSAAAPAARS